MRSHKTIPNPLKDELLRASKRNMENNYLCKECLHFFYNVVASGKCRKAGDFVSPFQAACKNFKPIHVREKKNTKQNL